MAKAKDKPPDKPPGKPDSPPGQAGKPQKILLDCVAVTQSLVFFASKPEVPAAATYQVLLEVGSTSMPMVVTRKVQAPPITGQPLQDGGFEQYQVTDPSGAVTPPAGTTPWVFSIPAGSNAGVAKNGSVYTNNNPNAPEGVQVCFLQTNPSVYQDIFLAAGAHTVTFAGAQRTYSPGGPQTIRVQIDGATVSDILLSGTSYQDYQTPSFTVAAGTHRLTLLATVTGVDTTAFIDNVRIDAPPIVPPNLVATLTRAGATVATYNGNTAIQQAAGAAQTGDIVLVNPGTYAQTSDVFCPVSMSIKSSVVGTKFTIQLSGLGANGITPSDGHDLTLEDCELLGPSGSQAYGIRGQQGPQNIILRRCKITHFYDGVKIGIMQGTNVTLEDCELGYCSNDPYGHNLYVDNIDSLTMRGCWSHDCNYGHLVKSRAKVTLLEACRLTMEQWSSNRCVDCAWGGDVTVRGCLLEINNGNTAGDGGSGVFYTQAVDFGSEIDTMLTTPGVGYQFTVNSLKLEQNTVINHYTGPLTQSIQLAWVFNKFQSGISSYVVKDNVIGGFVKAPVQTGLIPSYIKYSDGTGTITNAGSYELDETANTLISAPNLTAQIPNHATFDFSMQTPVVGSQNWSPYFYQHPTQHGTRSDSYRGGVPSGIGTLAGGLWTPPAGTIPDAAWAALPLNQLVEWAGTALESQLHEPYGVVSPNTFHDWGNQGIRSHFDAWAGMAFDDATGRFWGWGGGHADGSNNMLSCFDARTGTWTVAIIPTAQEYMPAAYKVTGGPSGNFGQVPYPNGVADNFMSTQSPAGDNKPTAMHTYAGSVYCNGEVVRTRGGIGEPGVGFRYWQTSGGITSWIKGGTAARNVNASEHHATYYSGILYVAMNGDLDNQYWTITRYDPVAKAEVGTMGLNGAHANWSANALEFMLPTGVWFIAETYKGLYSLLNLTSGAETGGNLSGRTPGYDIAGFEGGLGATYAVDIGKGVMLNMRGGGGAAVGEWITIDPTNGVCATAPITDPNAKTPTQNIIYSKIRYWSAKKVLILHSFTNQNARVVRLA